LFYQKTNIQSSQAGCFPGTFRLEDGKLARDEGASAAQQTLHRFMAMKTGPAAMAGSSFFALLAAPPVKNTLIPAANRGILSKEKLTGARANACAPVCF
jgi:hypothetical protein